MVIIAWIATVIVALMVLLVVIGRSMPQIVNVSRSTVIEATPTKIYNEIVDLKKFTQWSPWADKDPDMSQDLNGVVGVGAVMTWSGNKQVGQGKMEVIEAVKPNSAKLALDFGGMGTATAYWTLEKEGKATKATWAVDADMGKSPLGRLMGPMMDKWIGADYEKGLANLKARLEK